MDEYSFLYKYRIDSIAISVPCQTTDAFRVEKKHMNGSSRDLCFLDGKNKMFDTF